MVGCMKVSSHEPQVTGVTCTADMAMGFKDGPMGPPMRVSGHLTRLVDKELSNIQTVTSTKATGRMTRQTEEELTHTQTALNTKVTGKKINSTVTGSRFGQISRYTLGTTTKA